MVSQTGRKKFISITALLSIIFVEIFAILGLYALYRIQIQHVYNRIFVITILFILINIVIFIVCLFCIKSYQNIHRIFLLSITAIYTITMACLSYFIYAFHDDFLDAMGLIWERKIQDSINSIESRFNCQGFDASKPNLTCYNKLNEYMQSKSKVYSIFLGILSLGFIILTFISFYLAYWGRHADINEPNIMSLNSNELNDIKEPMNLDSEINI